MHDALTSLPNRATFNAQLDQQIAAASASGKRLAVLYLDLDRFKEVNDLYGHATGDKVLQTVATRVTGLLAKGQIDGAARRRRVRRDPAFASRSLRTIWPRSGWRPAPTLSPV